MCGSQVVCGSHMAAGMLIIICVTMIVLCGQTGAAACVMLCQAMRLICCEFACQDYDIVMQGVFANLKCIVHQAVGLL